MATTPKLRARTRILTLKNFCCIGWLVVVALLILLETSQRSSADHGMVKLYGYKILREFPHDESAFTQGLLFDGNNTLYESTGLYGQSSVREVDLSSGKVRKLRRMEKTVFGEGLTLWGSRLLQIAWGTNKGYMYDKKTLRPVGSFEHSMTDGWGLAHDGRHIIGSDGTENLYFFHPESLKELRRVTVKHGDHKVKYLNELEYVKGEIWANVWQTECIARISPSDGRIVGWILLQGMRSTLLAAGYKYLDVLNGIAWDSERDRLFVTGKTWPKLYEIKVEELHQKMDQNSIYSMCIL